MAVRQLGALPSRTRDLAEYGTGGGSGGGYPATLMDASQPGNGQDTKQTISNAFTTINLPTENVDPGNNFNPSTGIYTVPATGTYICLAKVRVVDTFGTAACLGIGVHTANTDHPSFVWNYLYSTGGSTRRVLDYQRIGQFNASDQLRLYGYADNGNGSSAPVPLTVANLVIVRIG